MGDGIYTALSGAIAQQHSLDVIANNVANASTSGFRGDRVVFGQLLAGAQKSAPVDPRQPAPPKTDQFVKVEMNTLDTSSGVLRHTGNALDLGLSGDGFFVVKTPQGERLTRSGNFMMREDGALSTVDGSPVLADDGEPLIFPQGVKDIQIASDGSVRADGSELGRLAIKSVADPSQLVREGTTTYTAPAGSAFTNVENASVVQGHLETSNVNAVGSLNELITVNRAFDALHRVIESFQQIDQRTARDLGGRSG